MEYVTSSPFVKPLAFHPFSIFYLLLIDKIAIYHQTGKHGGCPRADSYAPISEAIVIPVTG